MATADSDFPVHGLLPKKETGAWNFLNKYEKYDGRDTLIAILDTGVDPGADGLQVTSHGLPKIVDIYDATGSGDVDTSTQVEVKDGCITGLSGRKLKIPPSWVNPSGKYNIGIKQAYSCFPDLLVSRMRQERKQALWDAGQRLHMAVAVREKEEHSKTTPAAASSKTEPERLLSEELSARVDYLALLDEKYSDCGPIYDCIVFHDGKTWRGCVDTSECGDLASCKVLASYREEREWSTFSSTDMLNYSLNIHENGKLLEISCNTGSHGTHVACIAAANFPDCPERNGVAPGAQIITIKIGDSRLKAEESGSALVRAIIRVIDWKCDVINLSFGESARWANDGRVCDIIAEAVNRHGILFMSSASNNGPALSTLGVPGATINSVIGVSAYVSPEMMAAEYSLRDRLPGNMYSWSSCGPAQDGALGITIAAPGGAITSVPNWTLRGQQLMNGTSMSSPNACGAVALVLSGLKQMGLTYTTASIKRAMINTAKKIENVEPFSLGHGLIQVDAMFEYILKYGRLPEDNFNVNVTISGSNQRGIYLREQCDIDRPAREFTVTVSPEFISASDAGNSVESQKSKIGFKMSLSLCCTESWVSAPRFLELMNVERPFNVKVDHAGLSAGAHFTEVLAYDVSCVEKGPVFRVPITVLMPERTIKEQDYRLEWRVTSLPGRIRRHFIPVPMGSTYATVMMSTTCVDSPKIGLHCVQMAPFRSFRAHETEQLCTLQVGLTEVVRFNVKENLTLELCITKWWSSLGQADLSYSIQFHGVSSTHNPFTMHPGDSVSQLNVASYLRAQAITPTVSLTHMVHTIRPTVFTITALSSKRDQLPQQRQIFAAELTFTFKMTKAGEVTPSFPLLCDLLYESPYESQMWMLFDSNKQHMLTGDAYPIKYNYSAKLEPGEYTIKLHVRHEERRLLEPLKRSCMQLHHKLPQTVSVDVYGSQKEAILNSRKMGSVTLDRNATQALFFTAIPDDKLNKLPVTICAASYLSGTLTLIKDMPTNLYFHYVLAEPGKLNGGKDKSEDKPKDKQTEYHEGRLEFEAKWIAKFDSKEGLDLYDKLVTEQPEYVPFHLSALAILLKLVGEALKTATESSSKESVDHLSGHIKRALEINSLITEKLIDKMEVLGHFGIKNDSRQDATTLKTDANKKKEQLVDSLLTAVSLICDVREKPELGLSDLVPLDRLEALWIELVKFADTQDKKVLPVYIKYLRARKFPALAMQQINKHLENGKNKDIETLLVKCCSELGWTHAERYFSDWLLVRYPQNFVLF